MIALSAAISVCEKGGKRYTVMALRLLDEMKHHGLQPDVIVYSAAISACEKGGTAKFTENALSLFQEMKQKQLEPNVYTYSALISACEKGGEEYTTRALDLYKEMKRERIEPTSVTFGSLISACEKGGETFTTQAFELFVEMKRREIKAGVIEYTALISVTEKARLPSKAFDLFCQMKSDGIKPDFAAYTSVIKSLFDANKYSDAQELTREAVTQEVFQELQGNKWDLHGLSEATACMLLVHSLVKMENGSGLSDIIVVTGKGLNTEDPDGPVLRERVPLFVKTVIGIPPTPVEGNEGRFIISKDNFEDWRESKVYQEFKGKFLLS